MSDTLQTDHPADICLLLRVHGEQQWLNTKILPLLRQLEQDGEASRDEQGAALAYLEVLWLEAGLRAAETDAAAARLEQLGKDANSPTMLSERAGRYHAAVRRLRAGVDKRVRKLTAPAVEAPAPGASGL